MLSAREVQERILERISPLDPLELPISEAHGCVLAETVTAPEDLPPFATAAIDGFALRAEDTAAATSTPVSMTIVGEAASGRPFAGAVAHGEAVRISAGAAIPDGADGVALPDAVAVVGSSMAIGRAVGRGENIRPAGEDIREGEPVMEDGQRVRGMDVGVLAGLGRARVLVRPRPRVVVVATGDELRDPSQALGPGLVRDSNSFTVAGMVREAGAEPTRAGIVGDDTSALREKFQSFLPQADVFITTGGVSSPDKTHVREVLAKLGDVDFWPVSVRPGSTLAFGRVEGRPVFALPGNPVAVVVALELFVRPALLKVAGRKTVFRPQVDAVVEDGFRSEAGRETYVRVRAWRDEGGWRARLAGKQGPDIVSSVAGANALAIVPSDRPAIDAGDSVKLVLLEPLEGW
jgi:molybdopterin molybdotransferase